MLQELAGQLLALVGSEDRSKRASSLELKLLELERTLCSLQMSQTGDLPKRSQLVHLGGAVSTSSHPSQFNTAIFLFLC